MNQLNALLNERLQKKDPSAKMVALSKQSAGGNLTSISGLFSFTELSTQEKEQLASILQTYSDSKDVSALSADLDLLSAISSEVKAINNQAALLHGERIKRAQTLLKKYKEGAFTAWLITTYGNRQTPYNLLQYYEFYEALPKELKPQVDHMPRQAVYTLATRNGPMELKHKLISNYKGETKDALLALIRQQFPLLKEDKRRVSESAQMLAELEKVINKYSGKKLSLSLRQNHLLKQFIYELEAFLKEV